MAGGLALGANGYLLSVATLIVINAMLAQSVNVVQGLAGQVSLAQAGFMGLGAYGSAYLIQAREWSFWVAAAATLLAALGAGLVVAVLTVRFRELMHFAIGTLAFATIFTEALNNWNAAGGSSGYPVAFTLPKLLVIDPRAGLGLYWFAVFALLVLLTFQALLMRSTLGRCFVAVRENGLLAESLGVPARLIRILALTLSTIPAAAAGIVFAPALTYISPPNFAFTVLVDALLMTMIGGSGTLAGPVLGAVVFGVVPQLLQFSGELSSGVFGLLLVLLVLFTPGGILGIAENALSALRRVARGRVGAEHPDHSIVAHPFAASREAGQ